MGLKDIDFANNEGQGICHHPTVAQDSQLSFTSSLVFFGSSQVTSHINRRECVELINAEPKSPRRAIAPYQPDIHLTTCLPPVRGEQGPKRRGNEPRHRSKTTRQAHQAAHVGSRCFLSPRFLLGRHVNYCSTTEIGGDHS